MGNCLNGKDQKNFDCEKCRCRICKLSGNFMSLHVPSHEYANYWLCRECGDRYEKDLKEFNENYFQPDSSKRKDATIGDAVLGSQ